MGRILATIILMVSLIATCSDSKGQWSEQMVDLASHSLHAVIDGHGSPTVVLDGGIGQLNEEYRELQNRIASTTSVMAYDRAGYGRSETGPLPRDSRSEAKELRALLASLEIQPPYILVGHSLGGLNAQVFAGLYPEEVAGLVLLDPPPLGFILGDEYKELATMATQMTDEWQGIADRAITSEEFEERKEAGLFQMLASEHREMFTGSARQASSITSFGDTPLVVIASGIPNPMFGDDAEPFQLYWAEQSKILTNKSNQGQFILVAASTHYLHVDAIDLVVEVISSMVESMKDPRQ